MHYIKKGAPVYVYPLFISIFLMSVSGNLNSIVQRKTIIYPSGISENLDWMNSTYMPLEKSISRRLSIKGDYYSQTNVPWELVLKVLWGSYGHSTTGRTVPSISGNYSLIIYVCNETTAYRFIPETNNLSTWKEGDYRRLGGGYRAPIQLYVVLDTNLCKEIRWGNAEAGCAIQNIYLMSNTLNLGTVCQGGSWLDRTLIQQGLGLPENEKVLYKMPLGFPLPPFNEYENLVARARPSSSQLPEIRESNTTLDEALNLISSSHNWTERLVPLQELSQVLWASYGYSYYKDTSGVRKQTHRTVPSAHNIYPIRIYMVDSSGIYKYLPDKHTIEMIKEGDVRSNVAQVSGNHWSSSAPLIILIFWDDSHILTVDTTYCEVGLVAQNIFLESVAWGLTVDWGKADANEEEMRVVMGLTDQTNLHPASIVALGYITEKIPSAQFKIENLVISPSEVKPGEIVNINITIKNIGEISGKYMIKLKINNIMEESEEVMLDAGNETNVTYEVIKNTEGIYKVEIEDKRGDFKVKSPADTQSYLIYVGIISLIIFIAIIAWIIFRRSRAV